MRFAIFDMDGLLIDSEPLWQEAEIAIFASLDIALTHDQCRQTMGMRVDEAVRYWFERSPWRQPSCEIVTKRLVAAAARAILERGTLMPGAETTISRLHTDGFKLAIASSSPLQLIDAVVERFALRRYFALLHSAEHEPAGKPDPAVYRTAIERLGADPGLCVAFEDSVAGVRSAKAAGATVVAVPAAADRADPGFAIADVVLGALDEFSTDLLPLRPGQP